MTLSDSLDTRAFRAGWKLCMEGAGRDVCKAVATSWGERRKMLEGWDAAHAKRFEEDGRNAGK